jgi:ribosomal protein S18 acetylase RimI-like enzyme
VPDRTIPIGPASRTTVQSLTDQSPLASGRMPATVPRTGPLLIRPYRPHDFREVTRLWRATGLHIGPSDRREALERSRRRDPELFLVAERSGQIIGVVLGRYDGRRGWVNHLAVDGAARRAGVGGRLMTELERRLARKGCSKVNLHVEPENRGVTRFYESLGYEVRPLVFMQKWLRPGGRRRRVRP